MEVLDTDKKLCSILIETLQKSGVKDVVCSPGSRNTPLLLAVAARPALRKHFIVDERIAAFFGMGLSVTGRCPTVLICTSGTALLNYSPAIAEAYYQGIPLIVISADRPIQWIDQDDSQTLRQDGILDNIVKKSFSLPAFGDNDPEMQWYAERIANEAFISACLGKPGPVHINVRFGNPLGNRIVRPENLSIHKSEFLKADTFANKEIINNLAKTFSNSKVLIINGFMAPDERLQKELARLSKLPNVVVMSETISNLHLSTLDNSIDSTLTAYDQGILDQNTPDLVISLGGSLVSRLLKEYLRRNVRKFTHWVLGEGLNFADCFMAAPVYIEGSPSRFLKSIASVVIKKGVATSCADYKQKWDSLRQNALDVKNDFIKKSPWSELRAFDIILKKIPHNFNLFFSNGTAIRYAQLITHKIPHAEYCNRGVSGIDGSISTAIGASVNYERDTLIITGDLSMAYDVGSLAIPGVPDRIKIIVIDNGGGGIFRFIPSTSSLEVREEYFCMSPNLPLRQLADGYGWGYYEAGDEINLKHKLEEFLHSSERGILRVVCPGMESAEILKKYMAVKIFDNL